MVEFNCTSNGTVYTVCNSLLVGLPAKLLSLEPTPGRHHHSSSFGLSCYEGRSHYTCVERPTVRHRLQIQEKIQYKQCVLQLFSGKPGKVCELKNGHEKVRKN